MLKSKAVVNHSASPRFACIHFTDKHDMKNNSASKATFPNQEMAQKWVVPHPLKPKFSKNITRARTKNSYGKDCFGSKRVAIRYTQQVHQPEMRNKLFWSLMFMKSRPLNVLRRFHLQTRPSESRNISKCESTKDQVEKQKFPCVGLYWVVVSLAVMIFLCKINVIVLTPLLLCFFSVWNARCCWPKEVHMLRDGRNGRNKERLQWALNLLRKILIVVLEGLL